MSKDLLNKIRGAIDNNKAPEPVIPVDDIQNSVPVESVKPVEAKPEKPVTAKKKPKDKDNQPSLTSLKQLQETLKAEKEDFSFNRRLVYIDDNIGEALDLLRKEGKINANVLTSYLLKQFLLENKELLKALIEKKKGNIFFD